jgi:hypothetical protein
MELLNSGGIVFSSQSPFREMSAGPLVDPVRNVILSPLKVANDFEIIDVANPSAPNFFQFKATSTIGDFDAAAADCETGIVLVTADITSSLAPVYVVDLMQSVFAPGIWGPGLYSPITGWTAAQQQILSEAVLPNWGPGGIAIAQGTRIGFINSENGSDELTAIQLPATSGPGTGTPAIVDWVTCSIPGGFKNAVEPHRTSAYVSPNTGHAMATVVNDAVSTMAVIDLTLMLDPAIVPRTIGPGLGHACAAGVLPPSVVRFIPVP